MPRKIYNPIALVICLFLLGTATILAIDENKPTPDPSTSSTEPNTAFTANIINDEGGPVLLTGNLIYTNPLFTAGTSQPLIILEDQAGFVDRNRYYFIPPASQVPGQFTSDFFTSPVSYSLSLPITPNGTLRDVDNDDDTDTGVMVYAVAYWTNIFGDSTLEIRDQGGGGWSGAYASTRIGTDPDNPNEVIGGKLVIYAPDDQQGFPSGFGADGLLFTEDDPIVSIPQGYSVVDLEVEPFTFDRSREQVIDTIEPERSAVKDFSDLSYSDAFDEMVELFRTRYAYSELYNLDWDELSATYRPRFVEAELERDPEKYALAMRDLLWEIPDGHIGMPIDLISSRFQEETGGGLGFAIRTLDDGRIITSFITPGAPAEQAGIALGAEILAFDGQPLEALMEDTFVWAHQALATQEWKRLQQERYVTRFLVDTEVEVTYQNPGEDSEVSTALLTAVPERQSWSFSSYAPNTTGVELPLEYRLLPNGYGYVVIYSFFDDEYLTAQLWERMIQELIQRDVPGLIIDMRFNGGGNGFLADQMAAYFYQESHILGYSSSYNQELGDFFLDPRSEERYYLPSEDLRYDGEVAVVVGPFCSSACEFFTYDMTIDDRAAIVGQYATGGLGGGITDFFMPEDMRIRYTIARRFDANKEIHIEAQGVAPTVRVPVTEETLFAEGDVVLDAAITHLDSAILGTIIDGGQLALGLGSQGIEVRGIIEPGTRIRYQVTLPANRTISIFADGEDGTLDTVLRLFDISGQTLALENDDGNSNAPGSAMEEIDIGEDPLVVLVELSLADNELRGEFTLRIVESVDRSSTS